MQKTGKHSYRLTELEAKVNDEFEEFLSEGDNIFQAGAKIREKYGDRLTEEFYRHLQDGFLNEEEAFAAFRREHPHMTTDEAKQAWLPIWERTT